MVKHNQTIRRKIANEFFECVWPFWPFTQGIIFLRQAEKVK